MFSFSIRTRQNVTGSSPRAAAGSPRTTGSPSSIGGGSPRTEVVGEIDTRAPFQSVKAAVSLFGEVSSPKARPVLKKPKTAEERVLEKETQLHLAHKELEKFKEQLKSAETTKSQAARELGKANRTLQELTCKLETASESKQAAIAATEAAKNRAKELEEAKSSIKDVQLDSASWKQAVDSEREQYKASAAELIGAKQELTSIRQDFDAALDIKLSAFQEAADAQHATKVNRERLNELSKEIATMSETLSQVKIAIVHGQDEQAKNAADKEARLQFLRTAKEEAEKKILMLKEEESKLKLSGNLEEKLEETTEAIAVIQEQLKNVRESDLLSLKTVTLELEDAKNALEQVLKEKSLLCTSVNSLQLDLDEVKKDCSEWKEKEAKSESVSENLRVELERIKEELEAALAGEIKQEEASNDMQSTLQQLSSETDHARRESEELRRSIEDLKREAETKRNLERETEEKLQAALKEAEEAKVAAKVVNDQIHLTPLCTDSKNSESKDKIKLSAEEFESLRKKVEEFEKLGQMKVADAMAEVEAIKVRESEAAKRLEEDLKEIEDMKTETEDALKKAEMAEAAKQVVEGELQKWRQQEDKKVAPETSSNREEMEYI
ncbi:WEB family protein At1g12150-like [Rhododendron vialii]|uniref:WEB family protein At1g12150-like n=1 Tax=Rhododendron vialii TaxID=182163 RepID=UPI002660085F|nr:WEB family protein At1g12150-like [Rhododendron vialii]